MSATVLYMSMSLYGFVAGPDEGPDNGLGDGGERLHDWSLTEAEESAGGESLAEVIDLMRHIGRVRQEMLRGHKPDPAA